MASMSSSDLHKRRDYPKFREDMESHSFIHSFFHPVGFIEHRLSQIHYMRLPHRHCRLSSFRFPVSMSSSPLAQDESNCQSFPSKPHSSVSAASLLLICAN